MSRNIFVHLIFTVNCVAKNTDACTCCLYVAQVACRDGGAGDGVMYGRRRHFDVVQSLVDRRLDGRTTAATAAAAATAVNAVAVRLCKGQERQEYVLRTSTIM